MMIGKGKVLAKRIISSVLGKQEHTSELNVYRGYEQQHLQHLKKYISRESQLSRESLTDSFGRITLLSALPPEVQITTKSLDQINWPVPDDGYMSEVSEYLAVAMAVNQAGERFRMAELGAGWGPWTTLAAAMCKTKGIVQAEFLACEAMRSRISLLKNNLAANGLGDHDLEDPSYTVKIKLCAVSDKEEMAKFPEAFGDMGAAISFEPAGHDYRGIKQNYVDVPCYPLSQVLGNHIYDFIHMDIQGMEFLSINAEKEYVAKNVRSIFIGTHTRKIEGDLIDLMYDLGFTLILEKPCRFFLTPGAKSLMARTTHDGSQYWVNKN